jgi:putative DNA primase/helicase
MAARIMEPGCKVDTCPVFFGAQGTGKSSALEIIGGKWYRTINTSADSKDFFDALRGVLVAEVAEFDAFNRVENSRLKTLLSTAIDSYRIAYGRTTQDYKRTAVISATTNDHAWHRDETGGRRFLPIHCQGQIDLAWLRENREQLFAEALHRYRAGESWFDVPRDAQEAMITEHYAADPWEERLGAAISGWRVYTGRHGDPVEPIAGDPTAHNEEAHWGTLVTTNRIMTLALQLDTKQQGRRESIRVAASMRRRGWEQKTVRLRGGGTARAWVMRQQSEGTLI